jgi:hypothetical protein
MAFMISDNTTNASGCNPISGSSSTMVVVDYEEGESKFERFGKDKQEALKAWLENYQMGTTWEEGLISATD